MKKVLMVSYYYPPIASVGVFRTLKFAKYLPRFGWMPFVLTVKNPDPFAARFDPHFVEERISYVKTRRSYGLPLAFISRGLERIGINHKWLVIPDHFIGWLPHSIYLGKKIIEKEGVDAIYASAPPFTSILIAALLKQTTQLPLIIDYRDPWTSNPFVLYPTRIHHSLEKRMETWALEKADAVITVGQDCKRAIWRSFPFITGDKFSIIYNGYDPEDFLNLKPWKFDKFTILYGGSIYGLRVKDFEAFLEGCREMSKEQILDNDFQIVLVGSLARDAKKIIKKSELSEKLRYLGLKPHKEVVRLMLGADMLLLIAGDPTAVTVKIFEYLAAKRFILNLGSPTGEVAQIINEAKAGISIEPDLFGKGEFRKEIFSQYQRTPRIRQEVVDSFSRIELTKKLAAILSQVSY